MLCNIGLKRNVSLCVDIVFSSVNTLNLVPTARVTSVVCRKWFWSEDLKDEDFIPDEMN